MKKPSRPPFSASMPGRIGPSPLVMAQRSRAGSPGCGGSRSERGIASRKAGDDFLALLRLERADGIDERAAGLQPLGGAVEQLPPEARTLGDDLRPGAVEDFGMAAEGAGRGAGRVEQDGVELRRGSHMSASAPTSSASRPVRLDCRAVVQTTFRRIDARDAVAGGGELHGLAAGAAQRSSTRRHPPGSSAREARRRGPAPTSGPGRSRAGR